MTRGGKRGKLKQRVSPSSHRAWKSGRPRRIPTFPQRRRRLLHRHNFQTTPPVVGLSAQPGREPGGLGRLFEQSVWARLERQEPAADRDRRLPGPGRRASDRLQVKPQRCWVHKMRNLLERVRKRDYEAVRADAQAIYRAESRREAERAFRRFRARWQNAYPTMVKQLERDLPELLTFFDFPRPLWRKLRTTNVIERCFVEVRRRTRPMVCFVNVASVDRIIYAIFNGYNEQHEWRNRTLRLFTQAA